MKIQKFEDLPVWRLSLSLTKDVYDLTSKGLFSKDFSLRDQIRRATISISSNIAEGFEKHNNNEFIRFLKIAKGSSGEVLNHLYIARTIGYISDCEFSETEQKLRQISAQVGGLLTYLTTKRTQRQFVNPLIR